ncbi:hypothetical protein H6P81_006237 [Aristolochia fimbriata]|uniref:Uncharacterized protein n=1 Tax=Aristolochia fimbriata TaxID=158543 RepID=A0AAV7F1B4_ARIFI|nr:hypothetical protein H6P81_006237 [Aristolochia fimbriata]
MHLQWHDEVAPKSRKASQQATQQGHARDQKGARRGCTHNTILVANEEWSESRRRQTTRSQSKQQPGRHSDEPRTKRSGIASTERSVANPKRQRCSKGCRVVEQRGHAGAKEERRDWERGEGEGKKDEGSGRRGTNMGGPEGKGEVEGGGGTGREGEKGTGVGTTKGGDKGKGKDKEGNKGEQRQEDRGGNQGRGPETKDKGLNGSKEREKNKGAKGPKNKEWRNKDKGTKNKGSEGKGDKGRTGNKEGTRTKWIKEERRDEGNKDKGTWTGKRRTGGERGRGRGRGRTF